MKPEVAGAIPSKALKVVIGFAVLVILGVIAFIAYVLSIGSN